MADSKMAISGAPKKRNREGEYAKDAFAATMAANGETSEARIWKALAGKSRQQQELQKSFMSEFRQTGFGFVEGSKWTTYDLQQKIEMQREYMTEEQIFKKECKSAANTAAKIEWAILQGEGTPELGKGKGWFRDPSRGGAKVYLYDENLKTGDTFTKHQGRQTRNFSGPMEVASISSGTPDTPITPGAPGMPGTPVTPLPLPPSEPMGSTEKIPTPFDGEKLKADAKALIDVMAGNDCMSGFHAQLQIALASVETTTGPIRSNYRNVKVLRSLIDLCGKVMKVVEEADI